MLVFADVFAPINFQVQFSNKISKSVTVLKLRFSTCLQNNLKILQSNRVLDSIHNLTDKYASEKALKSVLDARPTQFLDHSLVESLLLTRRIDRFDIKNYILTSS